MKGFTVGVYGRSADDFVDQLDRAGVDVLVDVRARRGVRGAKYAWSNVTRLKEILTGVGIEYQHWKDTAPSKEIREIQRAADDEESVAKRERGELAPKFKQAYQDEILDGLTAEELRGRLEGNTAPALLCVEGSAAACHRSLLADFVFDQTTHLGE